MSKEVVGVVSDGENGINGGQIILKLNLNHQTTNDIFLKHINNHFENHSHSAITESSKHDTLSYDENNNNSPTLQPKNHEGLKAIIH